MNSMKYKKGCNFLEKLFPMQRGSRRRRQLQIVDWKICNHIQPVKTKMMRNNSRFSFPVYTVKWMERKFMNWKTISFQTVMVVFYNPYIHKKPTCDLNIALVWNGEMELDGIFFFFLFGIFILLLLLVAFKFFHRIWLFELQLIRLCSNSIFLYSSHS